MKTSAYAAGSCFASSGSDHVARSGHEQLRREGSTPTHAGELSEFCVRKKIEPGAEVIRKDQVEDPYTRLEHANIRDRFVIDMTSVNDSNEDVTKFATQSLRDPSTVNMGKLLP